MEHGQFDQLIQNTKGIKKIIRVKYLLQLPKILLYFQLKVKSHLIFFVALTELDLDDDDNKREKLKLLPKPGVCDFCQKTFATNTSLRRHIKCVHNGIKDVIRMKNYKCEHCEFTTRCQSYLDDHLISKFNIFD